MRLSAPNQIVWVIALVLGVLGIIAYLGVVPPLAAYAFWLVAIGFVLLVLATLLKGL
jgi:hypothetical protein